MQEPVEPGAPEMTRGGQFDGRSTTKRMQVDLLDDVADVLDLEDEWRALERSSNQLLPFATFDWTVAWWKNLRESKFGVRDQLFLHTIRDHGELVGVAPMMITHRPSKGPFRSRVLHFIGADPNLTEVRGALIHPAHEVPAYEALIEQLATTTKQWDTCRLSGIPARIDVTDALATTFARFSQEQSRVDFVIPLPESWGDLVGGLSRNMKEALRKSHNAAKRDGIAIELSVITAEHDVDHALDEFFRLHGLRAAQADMVRHADVFETPAARAFLGDVCRRFAAQDRLRIFGLLADGELVAARIGFVLGDSLYLYYSGFDPAYSKYSVMTRTVAEVIKQAIDARMLSVNLSTGSDRSKLRWRPEELEFCEVSIVSPGGRAAATRSAMRLAGAALNAFAAHGRLIPVLGRRAPPTLH